MKEAEFVVAFGLKGMTSVLVQALHWTRLVVRVAEWLCLLAAATAEGPTERRGLEKQLP